MLELTSDHVYYLDGIRIPGFHTIVEDFGFLDGMKGISPALLQKAQDFGDAVHLACQYHDEGVLDEDTLDEKVKKCLDAYKNFLEDSKAAILYCEQEFHYQGKVACKVDRILQFQPHGVIAVDIKTGVKKKVDRLQTACAKLCCEIKVDKRGCLYLSDDGSYYFEWHDEEEDERVFLNLVEAFHWKKPRYGKKKDDLSALQKDN